MINKPCCYSTVQKNIQLHSCNLHIKICGRKKALPTVVLDAGYGDSSNTWDSIISEISALTEVVVYDRAGLGKSGKSSSERTSLEMVKELNELLTKMKIKPPYLLVGHSFGGVNARIFASEYPQNVAGLVLVDSTPGNYRERFLPTMPLAFQDAYSKQFVHESNYDEFIKSLRQLTHTKSTIDIPMKVLSAGRKTHYTVEAQKLWHDLQKEIADTSTRGELIIAENSTHYIQEDEPEIIIEAVNLMLHDL